MKFSLTVWSKNVHHLHLKNMQIGQVPDALNNKVLCQNC